MVNKMNAFYISLRFIGGITLASSLVACQTDWQDASEGAAVKAAIRAQSVYPDGRPDVPTYVSGRDGITARSSIEQYQRSYALPAAGASGGAAPGAAPAPSTPPIQ